MSTNTIYLQGWDATSNLTKAGVKPKIISKFFDDFGTCLINVMWSTFGLFGVSVL